MIYFYSNSKYITKEKDISYLTISELPKLITFLSKEKELALDSETNGLDPLIHKVIMLQIGTKTDQFIIDTRDIDLSIFKPLLENKEITFIGHNIKFDYNMLKQYDIILNTIYDTMLADMVIYNGKYNMAYIRTHKRFSLAGVYKHHFGKTVEKDVRNEFTYIGSSPFTYSQIIYGAKDVIYPIELKEVQLVWIDRYSLKNTISLENRASLALGDIEYNGFKLDTVKWLKIHQKYSIRILDTEKKLDEILVDKDSNYKVDSYQLDLFSGKISNSKLSKVNWDSDQQVISILRNTFGITPYDKDNKISSSTKALQLLDIHTKELDIIQYLMKYRKESKVISTFGKKYLEKYIKSDGRLHTSFNSIVETGRVSSRNPNLQQVPSDKEFRECFIVEDSNLLTTADYNSQESRVMADLAHDEAFIDFFLNGDGDMHSFVATKLFTVSFGKEFIVTKDNENKAYRQKGKILNFMISFGGSAFTLGKTLGISVEEAQKLIDAFYEGFKGLKQFFDNNAVLAMNNGYIRTNTVTNRIRWIPEWEEFQKLKVKRFNERTKKDNSKLGSLSGRIKRKSQNSPIQGTSGDITKTALVLMREELLKLGIRPTKRASIKLVNVVHDETNIEATKDMIETATKIQVDCMEKAGSFYCNKVPLTASADIATYWVH